MASKHLISDSAVVPAHIAKQVVSPAAYADWDAIHEAFTELRKTLPLGLVEAPGFDPFWLVTKHADIMEISRQPLIFSNNDHRCALLSQTAERQYLETRDEVPFIRALVTMDAPENSRSEEQTSELQALMRISYAVLCMKKK